MWATELIDFKRSSSSLVAAPNPSHLQPTAQIRFGQICGGDHAQCHTGCSIIGSLAAAATTHQTPPRRLPDGLLSTPHATRTPPLHRHFPQGALTLRASAPGIFSQYVAVEFWIYAGQTGGDNGAVNQVPGDIRVNVAGPKASSALAQPCGSGWVTMCSCSGVWCSGVTTADVSGRHTHDRRASKGLCLGCMRLHSAAAVWVTVRPKGVGAVWKRGGIRAGILLCCADLCCAALCHGVLCRVAAAPHACGTSSPRTTSRSSFPTVRKGPRSAAATHCRLPAAAPWWARRFPGYQLPYFYTCNVSSLTRTPWTLADRPACGRRQLLLLVAHRFSGSQAAVIIYQIQYLTYVSVPPLTRPACGRRQLFLLELSLLLPRLCRRAPRQHGDQQPLGLWWLRRQPPRRAAGDQLQERRQLGGRQVAVYRQRAAHVDREPWTD